VGSGTVPLRDLTALVRGELERINRELEDDLRPQEPDLLPLVDLVSGYRGKQIRPALVCLSGKAIGRLNEDHIAVAKVVELLHTATLIHDDVLDGARLRRRTPTVNALYGPEAPILLGDYIYALAFHLSVELEDPTCSRVLSAVVRRMCQGEITQILHRFDFDWTESRYTDVITEKTALLYGSACRLGGFYAGGRGAALSSLERFGTELGIAFQIVDDCLDLDGDEDVVGKSLGTDLGKGKLTLPLLFLLNDRRDAPRLRALIESDAPDGEKLRRLRGEFDLELAVRRSIKVADERIARALAALRELPESPARDNLEAMAVYVLERRQ
jgi:octaprenyl-diphosphate synthase